MRTFYIAVMLIALFVSIIAFSVGISTNNQLFLRLLSGLQLDNIGMQELMARLVESGIVLSMFGLILSLYMACYGLYSHFVIEPHVNLRPSS